MWVVPFYAGGFWLYRQGSWTGAWEQPTSSISSVVSTSCSCLGFLHKQLSIMVFIRVTETKLTYRGSGD